MYSSDSGIKSLRDLLDLPSIAQFAVAESLIEGAIAEMEVCHKTIDQQAEEIKRLKEKLQKIQRITDSFKYQCNNDWNMINTVERTLKEK